jgi:hypothetical protein
MAGMLRTAACLILFVAVAAPADAIQLITEQEAALPNYELPMLVLRGSPTRRPKVVIVSPAPNAGLENSPLNLKIRFKVFGGAKIDTDSIVMTYKKTPLIDVTPRIMRFIHADGIDIPEAEVPIGIHNFVIQVRDNDGRIGGADFGFQVTK